jgi:hypothetical protein
VAVANGGTGLTSLTLNNLVVGNGTSAVNLVAPVAASVLTSLTGSSLPAWRTFQAGTMLTYRNLGSNFVFSRFCAPMGGRLTAVDPNGLTNPVDIFNLSNARYLQYESYESDLVSFYNIANAEWFIFPFTSTGINVLVT